MIAKARVVEQTVSPLIKQLCEDAGEDKQSMLAFAEEFHAWSAWLN
jgi:hypothetical protein